MPKEEPPFVHSGLDGIFRLILEGILTFGFLLIKAQLKSMGQGIV